MQITKITLLWAIAIALMFAITYLVKHPTYFMYGNVYTAMKIEEMEDRIVVIEEKLNGRR